LLLKCITSLQPVYQAAERAAAVKSFCKSALCINSRYVIYTLQAESAESSTAGAKLICFNNTKCFVQVLLRPDGGGGVRLPARLLALYSCLFDDMFQDMLQQQEEDGAGSSAEPQVVRNACWCLMAQW
jgi:hypothetical protein